MKPDPLQRLIQLLKEEKKLKPKSLISTVFGDLAVPLGQGVWVESLCQILAPFGISDRLVRTSLFRLVEDNWVKSTKQGRRSYYRLSEYGNQQTSAAEQKIYHQPKRRWDRKWTIVFAVIKPIDKQARSQLEQELIWMGFGKVSNHVWAHPTVESELITERIKSLGLLDKVVCMQCENVQHFSELPLLNDQALAANCLALEPAQIEYDIFIKLFEPSLKWQAELTDQDKLTFRILLLDQYRKAALRDPRLPNELLPKQWSGEQAYQLVSKLYKGVERKSEQIFVSLNQEYGVLEDQEARRYSHTRFAKNSK